MYIRSVKTVNKTTGTEYFTYRLVKNERVNGVPKQRNLISMGKLEEVDVKDHDILAKRIEELYYHRSSLFAPDIPRHIEELAYFYSRKLIQKNFTERQSSEIDSTEYPDEQQFVEVDINSTCGETSEQIGGEHLCMQAIGELGLDTFLQHGMKYSQLQTSQCMIALIGRLLYSSNESQTSRWLNDNSAIQEFYPQDSGRVNKNQLYRAANQLYKDRLPIEKYLNQSVEKIFNLQRKIVLYDLTNTHFEGQMKGSKKGAYGKNKQKRNDCPQITLGMLTDENGFAIHTEFYKGNIGEPTTLEQVLKDLSSYGTNLFTGEKPCIIMDAGIATDDNVKLLLKHGYQYICVSRGQHSDLIDQVNPDELVKFKNKSDKELSAQMFTQKLEYKDDKNQTCTIDESLIYIKSPDKEKKENAIDQKKCQRFEEGLQQIQKTINNPRGRKSIEKIHQRLGRLKERNRGITNYFDIQIQDDTKNVQSISWVRKEFVPKERKQGVYFLRTNIGNQEHEKLWHLYRLVNEVEEVFGTLKSELNLRPNFHTNDDTIEAHINMCVLSYHVVSFIRYRLKLNNINLCWSEIRRIMSTQKRCTQVTRTKSGNALWTKYCTRPIPQADKIYSAMGYKKMPYYRKNLIV